MHCQDYVVLACFKLYGPGNRLILEFQWNSHYQAIVTAVFAEMEARRISDTKLRWNINEDISPLASGPNGLAGEDIFAVIPSAGLYFHFAH